MNYEYLLEYLSRNLHTAIQIFTEDKQCSKTICLRADLNPTDWEELLPRLLSFASPDYPVLLADRHQAAWAVISHGELNQFFLLGPVLLISGDACRRTLPGGCYDEEKLRSLHQCSTSDLLQDALLLHNLFHEKSLTAEEASEANCLNEDIKYAVQKYFMDIIFQNQEYGITHNPYDQEIREVASIRSGDPEQLKKSWAEDYIGKLGVVAKTPLRNNQNLGIILVTLASRAAMEGGVMPELAYSLSDSYINKIEEATTPMEALSLGREAEYQYTALVQEIKKERAAPEISRTANSKISQCKDYIFSHLHEKISASDIAKKLYLNPCYLSDLFRRAEGITLTEYILQEKLKLAKNMLIYSPYSYNEIANYLGFSSQSHLGAKFKKNTGMTLHQYREKYGKKEFGHP